MTPEQLQAWLNSTIDDDATVGEQLEAGRGVEILREVALIGGKVSARKVSGSDYFRSHMWKRKDQLDRTRVVRTQFGCFMEGPRSAKDVGLYKGISYEEETVKCWSELTQDTHDSLKVANDSERQKCFMQAVHYLEGCDGHRTDYSEDLLLRSLLRDG